MLKTLIEKIKTDKVYQFGLILFVGVLGLKIMVDYSTKKHSAALQADQLRVMGASPAAIGTKTDTGYSVTAARPALGTAAGVALMNRKKAATRAVASSRESWTLNQSPRGKLRQEGWQQTSGYATLPGKGKAVPSYAGQRQVSGGTYTELKGSEMAALERELAGVQRPAAKTAAKKKLASR